jgi:hypothetical protein
MWRDIATETGVVHSRTLRPTFDAKTSRSVRPSAIATRTTKRNFRREVTDSHRTATDVRGSRMRGSYAARKYIAGESTVYQRGSETADSDDCES